MNINYISEPFREHFKFDIGQKYYLHNREVLDNFINEVVRYKYSNTKTIDIYQYVYEFIGIDNVYAKEKLSEIMESIIYGIYPLYIHRDVEHRLSI